LVTMEMLKSIGANVDLHAMDWSTMVSRRAKKEPPAQGGWNVFHTWSTSFDTMTPAVSSVLGGAGEKAWFGWPTSEAMEKLRADFAREPNEAKRKAIAEKVQVLAYDEVPYVPWGQFVIPGAFRQNVHDVLSPLVDGRSGGDRRVLRARDAGAGDAAVVRRGAAPGAWLLPRVRRAHPRGRRRAPIQHVDPRRSVRPSRRHVSKDPCARSRRARAVAPLPAPREALLRGWRPGLRRVAGLRRAHRHVYLQRP